MRSKTIHIENIGDILIEKSNKAKHIGISVKPFSGVRVAVPRWVSFRVAEKFVFKKINWIRKHVESMRSFEESHNEIPNNGAIENIGAAKRKLKLRLSQLAGKNGFDYNKVTIRNQKSRWGSCSSKNNISLNIKLVMVPEELMDYVILHELVHTKVKNHSSDFWHELDTYVGDAKDLRQQMKNFMLMML